MRDLTDERVVDLWSFAYAWRSEESTADQTDLTDLRAQQRAEIRAWMRAHDLENSRRIWAEAAYVARSYDDGTGTTAVTIAEEFESYAVQERRNNPKDVNA